MKMLHVRLCLIAYKSLIGIKTSSCAFGGMIVESSKRWNYSINWADSCDVDHAHNLAVLRAIEANADWLIIMGRDNYAPANQIADMIDKGIELNCAIIGAPCIHRNGISLNVVIEGKAIKSFEQKDVIEVEKIGSGIMAINLSWLKKNWPNPSGPWFASIYGPNGYRESQDYVFCNGVRSLGGKVYCDSRVDSGHDIHLEDLS